MTPFALLFLIALAGSSCFAIGRALGRGERYEKGYREGFRDGETGSLARAARLIQMNDRPGHRASCRNDAGAVLGAAATAATAQRRAGRRGSGAAPTTGALGVNPNGPSRRWEEWTACREVQP